MQDAVDNNQTYLEKVKKIRANDKHKIITLIIFCLIFLTSAITLGVLYSESAILSASYQTTLDSSYNRAVYELVDNINDIELNLNKASVSSGKDLQTKYLRLACDNCKYAQGNLAQLPANSNSIAGAVRFVNQVDGYCTSLINSSSTLSSEDKQKIDELVDIVLELKATFNTLISKLLQGYSILNNSEQMYDGINDFSANFSAISSDSISYPSMIFDGPFSDSLYNREIVGLPKEEVSENVAKDILVGILEGSYEYNSISYLGETQGLFNTYDYRIEVKNATSFIAQVAKRGGFLLTITCDAMLNENSLLSVEECASIARDFCAKAGASNMSMVWSEEYGGVAVLNMAPVVNNVIYYPDLIKVKVDQNSGKIIGYEAQNYAINHKDRVLSAPSLGATEARELLDPRLNVNTQKLCVMPLDYGGEVFAYEFNCEYMGATYYVYINANYGDEEKILKVVYTNEGSLLS